MFSEACAGGLVRERECTIFFFLNKTSFLATLYRLADEFFRNSDVKLVAISERRAGNLVVD